MMTEKEFFEGIAEYLSEGDFTGYWRAVDKEGHWRRIDGWELTRFSGKKVRVTIEEVPDAPEVPVADRFCANCKHRDRDINSPGCKPCADAYERPNWEPKVQPPEEPEGVPVTYKDGVLIMGDHCVAIDHIVDNVDEIERRLSHLGRPL